MTTTAKNITEQQIRSLRREALDAEDYDQAAVCDLALSGSVDADDYTTLSRAMIGTLRGMSQASAVAECARVIADAEAQ